MRLDPKNVRLITPMMGLYLSEESLPFLGRGVNIQLLETALVIEGLRLKVTLLGLERFVAKVLSEWSSLTIPYSRVYKAYYSRWPVGRVVAVIFFLLCVGIIFLAGLQEFWEDLLQPLLLCIFGICLSIYIYIRVRPRHVIIYKSASGKRRKLYIQIRNKKLRQEFNQCLQLYRNAAKTHLVTSQSQ